ncbi:MAG: NfeD family protein [Nocardioides sp.]
MNWLSDNAWAAWFSLALLLAVLELVSLDLILLMLALGAGAGALTSFATDSFAIQALVASAVSLATLGLVRPSLIKRLHGGPDLVTGVDKLIGLHSVATSDFTVSAPGRIKIDGEVWQAIPYDPQAVIRQGETVEVLQIRGATALVHPIPELKEESWLL